MSGRNRSETPFSMCRSKTHLRTHTSPPAVRSTAHVAGIHGALHQKFVWWSLAPRSDGSCGPNSEGCNSCRFGFKHAARFSAPLGPIVRGVLRGVDQAQLADLEAYGHLHFPSHEEALHKIIGLVMLDDPLPRERIAFGERRVWSRSQIFFLLCSRVICPTPMSPCNNIKQERQKLA